MIMKHCPACGEDRVCKGAREIWEEDGISVLTCQACESAVMDPPPGKDYSSHTLDDEAIRDYVEMNCAIDALVAFLLPAIELVKPTRYLDVGCGFGFSLDIVRRLTGAEVLGVEPAHYGRVGSKMLNLPILAEVLTGVPDEQSNAQLSQLFDLIFSSEVIEHIPDPDTLFATIRAFLKPGGMAVISTPRAESLLEDITLSEKRAVISPGAHVFLYTAKAFEAAARRAGFEHVEIRTVGVTQILYASETQFVLPDVDINAAVQKYLTNALEENADEPLLGIGLAQRLFRLLIQTGDWEVAEKASQYFRTRGAPPDIKYTRYRDYLADFRACEAVLSYHKAMLHLNHRAAFTHAFEEFRNAFRFCLQVLRTAPGSSVSEADIVWLSVFHAALAASHERRPDLAKDIWREVVAAIADGDMPTMPTAIRARIRDDLRRDYQPPSAMMAHTD